MKKFDVFIFGTGSAGQYVAKDCAKNGLKTAIIDSREYGGVCALRGCDPKKLMLTPIMAYQSARALMGDGLKGESIHRLGRCKRKGQKLHPQHAKTF